jgi:hypothetical protein
VRGRIRVPRVTRVFEKKDSSNRVFQNRVIWNHYAIPSPLNFQLCASMSKIWAGTTDRFQQQQINLRLTCKQKQPICFKNNK